MKSMRISVITLVLSLAAASAAWGTQSVMNLISSGEAVNKEVDESRAAYDALTQQGKEMEAESKSLAADEEKLKQDSAAYETDREKVEQSMTDYKNRCSSSRQLTPDQYKACNIDQTQINADAARVNNEYPTLTMRKEETDAKLAKHNEAAKGMDDKIKDAYATLNNALKKQGSWLDEARTQLNSDAFKPYAAKAGCPDTSKPAETPEAEMKMASDVLACLKKVSDS